MTRTTDYLLKGLKESNIDPTDKMTDTFLGYMEGILEWNEKINLTAITDREDFIQKHFIDSLLCAGYPEVLSAKNIIDVGTGAGFPGIPLAIVFPDKNFVLMDSLRKRLKVIDELCEKLNINNVTTLHGRAEDLARDKNHRESYDLCVARAVANLAVLSEYTLPFIKRGGNLLAYKGPDLPNELIQGKKAIRILGGEVIAERQATVTSLELDHKILVIHKIKNTPAQYPRKAGTPSKEPLK